MHVPYYDKGGVKITKDFFNVPSGKQFSVKNIDSISIKIVTPNYKNPIICLVVGIILLAVYGLGIILIIAGILWWKSQKNIYYIYVTTAGNEGEAYHSYDMEEIREVRSALNAAIEAD